MAELNVGTVVADLELRDKQFLAACGAATTALGSVERAGEAAGASIAPAMAPAATALAHTAEEAQRATAALMAMSATPLQRVATAANEAAAEIARLESISGNTAAAEAARGALAQRTAAAMGAVGKKTAEAGKAATSYGNAATQAFYQISDAASQLSTGTPIWTILIQQGGQLLPVLASVSSALLGFLPILAPIGAALGLVALGYYNVSKEAAKADAAVEQSRKTLLLWQEASKSTAGAQDELKRQIALANGEITNSEDVYERAASAYTQSQQKILDAAQETVDLRKKEADDYVRGLAERLDGDQRAIELQLIQSKEYAKLTGRVQDATTAYRQQAEAIEADADMAGNLAMKQVLEAEAAAAAANATKGASKALKEHTREAKDAAAALRAFVALYEQAADVVYAKKEVPGAELFAKAAKLIEEVVPPKALSAMERFDMLAADIAAQFSRGLIDAGQFAQLETLLTQGKAKKYAIDIGAAMAEQSTLLAEAQREAAAAMSDFVGGLKDKLMGNLGKLGTMIQSVVSGAQSGGVWGAVIAGIVELVGSNLKLQRAMDTMDEAFTELAEIFDPIIEVIHQFGATDTQTLKAVFEALGPVFEMLADVIKKFAPFAAQLGQFLQLLGPIFQFLMDAIQPLLSIIDTLARVIFKVVGSIMSLVGTLLTAIMSTLEPLAPLLALLEVTLRPIFFVLDLLADGLGMVFTAIGDIVQFIVGGISKAYNWIVDGITKLLKAIGIKVDIPRMDTGSMFDAMDELNSLTYDSAMATTEQNAAVNESTEGFDKLNESLSNVPSGFKVAQKAFEAAAAAIYVGGVGKGGGYVTPAEGMGYGSRQTVSFGGGAQTYIPGADRGGGGVTIYIDRLEVRADDADSLVEQLSAIAGRRLFARTGSTVGSGLPFASMQVP